VKWGLFANLESSGRFRARCIISVMSPVDWRATMRWQDQLQEGDEVVGTIRNPR
jgi:hypothetical protein